MLVWGEVHAQGHPSQGGKCGIESSLSKSGPHSYSVFSVVHTLSAFLLFVACVFVALPVPPLEGKLHEDRDRHMVEKSETPCGKQVNQPLEPATET